MVNGIPSAERYVYVVVSPIENSGCSAKESDREPQSSLEEKSLLNEQSLKPRQNNLGWVLSTVQESQQSKLVNNPSYSTI